jgi:hypothetical protein
MNNPPAFPLSGDWSQIKDKGMSLRDYFAAKAMQGYCSNAEHIRSCTMQMTANSAYEVADAMLKARET